MVLPPAWTARVIFHEMQRHGAAPGRELLTALIKDRDADVRAAVITRWRAGRPGPGNAGFIATAGLKDANPVVRRRAAEALVRLGQSPDKASLAPVAESTAVQ